jgi:DNA primase
MNHDLQSLKERIPLLDYLRRHDWTARPIGAHQEFVGLCPLHPENHPSFYVNAAKNVFYCHGCGRGGDLIRFVQLSLNLSFREALVYLKRQLGQPELGEDEALWEAADFYRQQLGRHPEALDYLHGRGVHDARLIDQLSIGYAPGAMLYRHMSRLGYPADLLLGIGLIHEGKDAFYRRIVFPCFDGCRPINLYGRSIGGAAPHRFLPRPKGDLFAWSTVRNYPDLILVEGLFDLAVLWQAGFINTTCAFGVHPTDLQFSQLSDRPDRTVFIAFDPDPAGANAARTLAQRLQQVALNVRIVDLPSGQDPNRCFVDGASAAEFDRCLRHALSP